MAYILAGLYFLLVYAVCSELSFVARGFYTLRYRVARYAV
jgi:hypothetical protein